ncbi:MAG: 50S ribosomal protein L22 [Actinobacteria bacterium]|nr:50S ribosomal protein L22 [Actinomycetota bacterium]
MTGPKLNERSFVAGERAGTKASAKYMRFSASKARAVLDLVRGLPVRAADEVLQFTDRDAAVVVRKVLASAVANAQHNDEQDPEELYIVACYADEGPTLKRFTPRARGRAGSIRKRSCHITVVVARLDDERLEIVQAREARRTATGRRRATGGPTASRRARVERSRQRATSLKAGDETGDETGDAEGGAEPIDDADARVVDDVAAEAAPAKKAPAKKAPTKAAAPAAKKPAAKKAASPTKKAADKPAKEDK